MPDEASGKGGDDQLEVSRRSLLAGAAGMGGVSVLPLQGIANLGEKLDTDPHTLDTYGSIVDAIIPRTPDLAVFGDEQVPGALEVELQKYVVFQLNYAQDHSEGLDVDLRSQEDLVALVQAIEQAFGVDVQQVLGVPPEQVFGALEGFSHHETRDGDWRLELQHLKQDHDGREFGLSLARRRSRFHRDTRDAPYLAEAFSVALDLYALLYILNGSNQQPFEPREKFPAGGLYTMLSAVDRLLVLLFAIEEPDALPGEAQILPASVVEDLASATWQIPYFGYYTEWSAYGRTKTNEPGTRRLQKDVEDVQAYRQIGYPGPQPGFAEHRGFAIDRFRENQY